MPGYESTKKLFDLIDELARLEPSEKRKLEMSMRGLAEPLLENYFSLEPRAHNDLIVVNEELHARICELEQPQWSDRIDVDHELWLQTRDQCRQLSFYKPIVVVEFIIIVALTIYSAFHSFTPAHVAPLPVSPSMSGTGSTGVTISSFGGDGGGGGGTCILNAPEYAGSVTCGDGTISSETYLLTGDGTWQKR